MKYFTMKLLKSTNKKMERTDFYRVHQTKDLTDHGN